MSENGRRKGRKWDRKLSESGWKVVEYGSEMGQKWLGESRRRDSIGFVDGRKVVGNESEIVKKGFVSRL